ncbi:MAG: ATP-binding protein [Chloroflexi bacterium]|nr:ATP-binding protein [Chloroflexota bacterium]
MAGTTGGSASGKTHLAAAIGNAVKENGGEVVFVTVPDLLDKLRQSFGSSGSNQYDAIFSAVRDTRLLILDDLSALRMPPPGRAKSCSRSSTIAMSRPGQPSSRFTCMSGIRSTSALPPGLKITSAAICTPSGTRLSQPPGQSKSVGAMSSRSLATPTSPRTNAVIDRPLVI